MPYWKRAHAWAKEHTQTYSLKKAAPSVIVAILQYLFSGRNTFNQMLISVSLVVASYFLLLSGEYLWNLLIAAPGTIDSAHLEAMARSTMRIADLQTRLDSPQISPLEKSRRALVKEKLERLKPDEVAVLKHVLQHGEVDLGIPETVIAGIDDSRLMSADQCVGTAVSQGLLRLQPGINGNVFRITPDLQDALAFHLLGQQF